MSSEDGAVDKAKDFVTPDQLPDWINNPDRYIRSRITAYLLGLIAGVVAYVEGAITAAFGAIEQAFGAAGASYSAAWEAAMIPIIGFFDIYVNIVTDVSASLGPFGPIFAALVTVVSVVVLWRLLIAILDSIPGVQGVVTFFRGG